MAKNSSSGGNSSAPVASGSGASRTVSTTSDVPIGGRPTLVPAARLEADVIEWNSEGTEQQPDDNGEVVGAPIPRDPDPDRDAKVRELLYGKKPGPKPKAATGDAADGEEKAEGEADDAEEGTEAAEGEGEAAEGEAESEETEGEEEAEGEGEEEATEEKPPAPAAEAKPKRRDILASIAAERARVALENSLKTANARAAEAEAKAAAAAAALQNISKTPLLKLMRERGLTKEQAIEALVAAEEEDATAEQVAAAAPVKAADPEVAALAREVAELRQERRKATDEQANAIVRTMVSPLDLPLVNTTKRVPVPQDDGRVVYQTPEQVIIAIAEQRWIAEGRPPHIPRVNYLPGAAETLEEALREEFGHTEESYAALRKRTNAAAAPPAAKKPAAPAAKPKVPSVGKRVAHTTTPPDPTNGLSMDIDERKRQIKARMGL